MQVFKLFMKIASRRLTSVIMYFVIFAVIAFLMTSQASEDMSFESTRLTICVNDLDNSDSSKELMKFFEENHNVTDVEYDEDGARDAIYYHFIECTLTINEGFEQKLAEGETYGLFEVLRIPERYGGVYLDNQLRQIISAANAYIAAGYEPDEACSLAREAAKESVEVNIESFGEESKGFNSNIGYFMQYLAYIFICILIAGLGPILMKLGSPDIRRRTNSSALPISSNTLQMMLGTGAVVMFVWLAFMILAAIVYGGDLFTERGLLCLLNSLIYIIVATGITMIAAQLVKGGENVLNMVSNTVGLGMSFLCGVFVPQNLLSDGVLSVSKFLPAYWYVRANNMICGFGDETYSIDKYLSYLGIELLFAVALFSAVMVISKNKMRTK